MWKIEEVTNKRTWEAFLLGSSVAFTPFFQSWNWGEVQSRIGNVVFRLGLFRKKKLTGICQIVEVRAKRGHYFHLRHGPVLEDFRRDFGPFIAYMKQKAKEQSAEFIRTSPLVRAEDLPVSYFANLGFRNAPIHNMDAENTLVLDLSKNDDELFSEMRKTTRYLVRKATSLPIDIKVTVEEGDFKKFLDLYEETSKRHSFTPHRNLREEFFIFTKDGQAKLFLATYKKKLLSGALIIFYGNQAVYHHGASSDTHKEIPASYLVQWEAIREAKRQGKKLYNFWGVVPENKPNHPWQGLTLFKTGFGGRRLDFIHAQDLPLSPWYFKTYLIESTTKLLKGY